MMLTGWINKICIFLLSIFALIFCYMFFTFYVEYQQYVYDVQSQGYAMALLRVRDVLTEGMSVGMLSNVELINEATINEINKIRRLSPVQKYTWWQFAGYDNRIRRFIGFPITAILFCLFVYKEALSIRRNIANYRALNTQRPLPYHQNIQV
jgi:hypothetical protein